MDKSRRSNTDPLSRRMLNRVRRKTGDLRRKTGELVDRVQARTAEWRETLFRRPPPRTQDTPTSNINITDTQLAQSPTSSLREATTTAQNNQLEENSAKAQFEPTETTSKKKDEVSSGDQSPILLAKKDKLKADFEAVKQKLEALSTAGKPEGFWNDTRDRVYKQVVNKVSDLLASENNEHLSQVEDFVKQLEHLHILAQIKEDVKFLGNNQLLSTQDQEKYDNFTQLSDTDPSYKQTAQEIMELADMVRARRDASNLLRKMDVVTDLKALKEVLKDSGEFDKYFDKFKYSHERLESFIQNKDKSEPQGQELSQLVEASKDLSESCQNLFQNLNDQVQNWRKETKSIEKHINKYFQGITSGDIDTCFFEAFRHCQQDFPRLLEEADITNKYNAARDSSNDSQPVRNFIETLKNLAGSEAELARFESLREYIKVETVESWRKKAKSIEKHIDEYIQEVPQGISEDIDNRFLTQFSHCQQDFSGLLEEANKYKEVQLDFKSNPDVRGSILQSFENLVAREEELGEFENIRKVVIAVRDIRSSGSTHESMLAEKIQAGEMNDTLQIVGKLQSLRSFEYLTDKTKYVADTPIEYWKLLVEVNGMRARDTVEKAEKVPYENMIGELEKYSTIVNYTTPNNFSITTDHDIYGSYWNRINREEKEITCLSIERKGGLNFSEILRHHIRWPNEGGSLVDDKDFFGIKRIKHKIVTNRRTQMVLAICRYIGPSKSLREVVFKSTTRKTEINLRKGLFTFIEGSQKHTSMLSAPNVYGALHLRRQDFPDSKITQIENSVDEKGGLDITLHFNKDVENSDDFKARVKQDFNAIGCDDRVNNLSSRMGDHENSAIERGLKVSVTIGGFMYNIGVSQIISDSSSYHPYINKKGINVENIQKMIKSSEDAFNQVLKDAEQAQYPNAVLETGLTSDGENFFDQLSDSPNNDKSLNALARSLKALREANEKLDKVFEKLEE